MENMDFSGEKICKYCHENVDKDWVHPCKCTGTLEFTHEDCLLKWLQVKKLSRCEICNENIYLKNKGFKAIEEWVIPKDLVAVWHFFILITFLVILSFIAHILLMLYHQCVSSYCFNWYGMTPMLFWYVAHIVCYINPLYEPIKRCIKLNTKWKVIDRVENS